MRSVGFLGCGGEKERGEGRQEPLGRLLRSASRTVDLPPLNVGFGYHFWKHARHAQLYDWDTSSLFATVSLITAGQPAK